jgi:hypothetical protein
LLFGQGFATPLSLGPTRLTSIPRDFTPAAVYNWNFGIQRNIGFGTHAGCRLRVASVGNTQKHLLIARDLNAIPYGTNGMIRERYLQNGMR